MTDAKPIRAKGPTHYDLVGMGDEDFERMVARLVRLQFPNAFKPANTADGGADMVLPGAADGYERCWQAKHFPKAINWTNCKESLKVARTNWRPTHYTFCFPRELTFREQKTFDEHFRGPRIGIEVDYWNGEELQARLTGSDAGQRVARTFFADVELDRERTNRAIEAAGRLDTPEDALDRLANIGGFLAGEDAYFSYPAATHEADGPAPPVTPGTVMSVEKSEGGVTSRIDVVPRDAEGMERYGPEFVIEASEGEEGERAAARLQEALREGNAADIDEGLSLTFTRIPPGLEHVVGQTLTGGSMRFGAPERVRRTAPPWRARLRAVSDVGEAALDAELTQVDTVPEGWDDALSGHHGGLTATALFRLQEGRGEMRWNFHYSRDDSPVREQLASLTFLRALSGDGELVVSDRGKSRRPEMRVPTPPVPLPADSQTLLAFFEDVGAIEEWADVEYTLPETVSAEEVRNIAVVAKTIRDRGRSITWESIELTVASQGVNPLREGRLLRVEQPIGANLLGRIVNLGHTQLDIADYTVVSTEPDTDQPGYVTVRIEPGSPAATQLFQRLTKVRTRARRPPPPPRRKGKRKRRGKRRR